MAGLAVDPLKTGRPYFFSVDGNRGTLTASMAKKKLVQLPEAVSVYMAKIGRKGGKAKGKLVRAGEIAVSGAAVPIPTPCPRCGETMPSARQAWRHCRGPVGRPKNKS